MDPAVVGALVTGISTGGTVLVSAFYLGRKIEDAIGKLEDMRHAHHHVHRDVDRMSENVNGDTTSNVETCPVCKDLE